MNAEIRKALTAIAEGYAVSARDDRYILVENPNYQPDNGSDPFLCIDTATLDALPEAGAVDDVQGLRECPHCGSTNCAFVEGTDEDGRFVAVVCPDCGAGSAKHYHIMDDARPNAANAWNRRAAPDRASVLEEAIKIADHEAKLWGHRDGSSARVVAARLRRLAQPDQGEQREGQDG